MAMELTVWMDCRCGKPVKVIEGVSKAALDRMSEIRAVCPLCGSRMRRKVTRDHVKEAVERFKQEEAFRAALAPARDTDGSYKIATDATFAPKPRAIRRENVTVTGAAKLYHYAVYVRHPWGTDRIVVGVKKQSVQAGRDEAWDRVARKRRTVDLKIMDCVPMKWTEGGLVETRRRTTIKKKELKPQRRAKSRVSVKVRKAGAYQGRTRGDDDATTAKPKPKRRSKKIQYVSVKGR